METQVKVKKNWFVLSKDEDIRSVYKFDLRKDKLGEGSCGKVIKAKSVLGDYLRAIKIITKNKIKNQERFKLEIEILRNLDHPNIIKLYETYEDPRNVYLVMELCSGGELFDRLVKKDHFTESEARHLFLQIMRALYYCHSNNICHRDLKPENFLFLDESDDPELKVIDFGLSTIFIDDKGKKRSMHTKAGTPYYIAPEVLDGEYDEKCDIWSAGVLLFILLCGYPPFSGKTDEEIIEKVQTRKFSFDGRMFKQKTTEMIIYGLGDEWKSVSSSAKDLIKKMICSVHVRLSAAEVLEHPWMKKTMNAEDPHLPVNFGSLKNFRNAEKLKKAALTYIANLCTHDEIRELSKVFQSLDKTGDGALTFEELKAGLSGLNARSARELDTVFKSMLTDDRDTINYTEFLAATIEKSIYMQEEKLWAAFQAFDKDGDGKITADELREVLGSEENTEDMEYWEQMISEVDANGDGEIDFNDFIDMMSKNKK